MEKHAGFKQEEIVDHYDDLCTNYEAIYLRVGFHDPKKCAELSKDCYNLVGKDIADVDVLDMGCGTGLVGGYLYEDGFRSIVGLDASKGMLKETE
jgi:predicted TPR repeat methyltransferase